MSFRSMTSLPKRVGSWVLLFGIAAGLWAGAPDQAQAAKPQPSPFAGCYGDGTFLVVTISDSGRIAGTYVGIEIKGSISNNGIVALTFWYPNVSWDDPSRGGSKWTKFSASGIGVLDEAGDLHLLLQWEDGYVSELLWPRCD